MCENNHNSVFPPPQADPGLGWIRDRIFELAPPGISEPLLILVEYSDGRHVALRSDADWLTLRNAPVTAYPITLWIGVGDRPIARSVLHDKYQPLVTVTFYPPQNET